VNYLALVAYIVGLVVVLAVVRALLERRWRL
jgi:hypothetical protein